MFFAAFLTILLDVLARLSAVVMAWRCMKDRAAAFNISPKMSMSARDVVHITADAIYIPAPGSILFHVVRLCNDSQNQYCFQGMAKTH